MARNLDPFAGTDFAQGGMPRGNEAPPSPYLDLPPIPPLSDNPRDNARVMQNYLDVLYASAGLTDVTTTMPSGQSYTEQEAALDPRVKARIDFAQKQVAFWIEQAQGERTRSETETAATTRQEQADAAALARTQLSTGATLGAAGISAGASRFSAEEATRRQQEGLEFGAVESGKEREFKAGESAATRAGALEQTTLANTLAGQREEAQRGFEAEQKALDREISRIQLGIEQGKLNLSSALGQLQKYLEAQPYTLPKGAEYVPGFQPGGAVQEGARLAGVGYNPANYKANTVPFDPAALVRQTMGR